MIPVTGDKQEGNTRTGPRRVVNRWGNDNKRRVVCVHDDRGVCSLHGPGAREMSKPVRVTRTGPGGKQKCVMSKKKWFKCDVVIKGGNPRQTTLSFGVVLDASRTGRRDSKGSLGQNNASVGQDLR